MSVLLTSQSTFSFFGGLLVSLMPAVAPRTGPVGARTGAGAGTGAGNGGYRGGYTGGNAPPPVAVPPSEEAIETLMVKSITY